MHEHDGGVVIKKKNWVTGLAHERMRLPMTLPVRDVYAHHHPAMFAEKDLEYYQGGRHACALTEVVCLSSGAERGHVHSTRCVRIQTGLQPPPSPEKEQRCIPVVYDLANAKLVCFPGFCSYDGPMLLGLVLRECSSPFSFKHETCINTTTPAM